MKERPIIFSAPMVRAILEGRKSQTRRLVTPQPRECAAEPYEYRVAKVALMPPRATGEYEELWFARGDDLIGPLPRCPYGVPGDRLWVRETYSHGPVFNADQDYSTRLRYRANEWDSPLPDGQKWRPAIHMPRWASRITLEVTDVRVQRLQDISEDDAAAEGLELLRNVPRVGDIYRARSGNGDDLCDARLASRAFAWLWDEINGKRAPWESNPWVWAITFAPLPAGAPEPRQEP